MVHPSTVRPSLPALTGLRFVAAIWVVVYHYGRDLMSGPAYRISSAGFVGVDLFFVLSGFVLAYVYGAAGPLRVRPFLAARIARVYPLYVLGLGLAAASYLSPLLKRGDAVGAFKAVASCALHLTMSHAWVGHVGVWNVPDWSVSCEWAFYLAFPFVLKSLAGVRHPLFAMVVLWATGLVLPFVVHSAHPTWIGASHTTPLRPLLALVEYHPLFRLHEFALGVLLARARLEGRLPRWCGAPLIVIVLVAVLGFGPALPALPTSNGLLAPLFCTLIAQLATGRGLVARALSSRPFVKLGDASYAIYILHWPVWSLSAAARGLVGAAAGFTGYVVLVIATSLLAFEFLEKPMRHRLRDALA